MKKYLSIIKYHQVTIHIFCWLLMIIYEQSYVFMVNGDFSLINLLYFYGCNVSLFYCQTLILDYSLGKAKKEIPKGLLLTIIEMTIFLAIKAIREYFLLPPKASAPLQFAIFKQYIVSDLYRNITYAGLATLIWSLRRIDRFRRVSNEARIRELSASRDKAELQVKFAATQNAYLQQQLNPHLFFNTLNFIYNSVYKYSKEGAKAVLLLSDMMRYSLTTTGQSEKVTLDKEVEQIEHLININRYRFHYQLDIRLNLSGRIDRHQFIPLILVTIAENIFKHGNLDGHPAEISLDVNDDGILRFSTVNVPNYDTTMGDRKSIGLNNTRLRLDYAYPETYTLNSLQTADCYTVNLTVQL